MEGLEELTLPEGFVDLLSELFPFSFGLLFESEVPEELPFEAVSCTKHVWYSEHGMYCRFEIILERVMSATQMISVARISKMTSRIKV